MYAPVVDRDELFEYEYRRMVPVFGVYRGRKEQITLPRALRFRRLWRRKLGAGTHMQRTEDFYTAQPTVALLIGLLMMN
jgi:hypothetical protein